MIVTNAFIVVNLLSLPGRFYDFFRMARRTKGRRKRVPTSALQLTRRRMLTATSAVLLAPARPSRSNSMWFESTVLLE